MSLMMLEFINQFISKIFILLGIFSVFAFALVCYILSFKYNIEGRHAQMPCFALQRKSRED